MEERRLKNQKKLKQKFPPERSAFFQARLFSPAYFFVKEKAYGNKTKRTRSK